MATEISIHQVWARMILYEAALVLDSGEAWEEAVCIRRLTIRYSKVRVVEVAASTRRHLPAVDSILLDRVWVVILEAQEWVDGLRILSVDSVAATLYDRLSLS